MDGRWRHLFAQPLTILENAMKHGPSLLTVLALPALLVTGCDAPTPSMSAAAVVRPDRPAGAPSVSDGAVRQAPAGGLAAAKSSPPRVSNGRLAFQLEAPAGDHTQADIYTVRHHGSQLRALTTTPDENEFGPAWDATGTRIAFWRTPAPFGPGSIWTMDGDGTHQRQLTTGIDARDPVWNPAGTRIAFTLVDATGFHIWSMRASDGGDRRPVTSGPAQDFEPAWSPDGTRIAFTRGLEQGDPGDICVLDLNTGAITVLAPSAEYDHQVAWSPDGTRVVFERDFGNSSSIFTVNADGSQLTRLTSGTFFDVGPTFSPDGRFIAFGSDRAGTILHDLWAMTADGRHLHRILKAPYSEAFPDWQPLKR
jgi:Tol biopolymer transport system component